jgi:hypothetical protein
MNSQLRLATSFHFFNFLIYYIIGFVACGAYMFDVFMSRTLPSKSNRRLPINIVFADVFVTLTLSTYAPIYMYIITSTNVTRWFSKTSNTTLTKNTI